MTVDEVLKYYGSQSAVARALGVSQPSVAKWVRKGEVPTTRQYQLEVVTGHRLKADRPERRVKK